MICKICGKEINDGVEVCPYCGARQTEEEKKELFSEENKEKLKEAVKDISGKAKETYRKSDRLFENVGDKLCKAAKIIFWIGVIASVLNGLFLLVSNRFGNFLVSFIDVIITTVAFILLSWLSALSTYGMGELIRRVQSIDEKLK
ncbi:MAG: zinc ribbon domain-containing protein [Erysipelotrichaceae bacterium]|nr:zinc ribbon domain-containing protein [Erysipelotrichaceae bacterium]